MNRKQIEEILKRAQSFGADFAEFYWEHKNSSMIKCEDNKIEQINSGIDEGVGIRVLTGENTSYAYTNEVNFERLMEVAELVGKAADKGIKGEDRVYDFFTPKASIQLEVKIPPDKVEIKDKVNIVKDANTAARSVDERIRQVRVGYGDVKQKVVIANTEGIYVEDLRTRTRLNVNAVAAKGDLIQTGYQSAGGTTGLELFEEKDPANIGRNAARKAVLMLSAQAAPSGKMPVVLAGKAGGTLVHEACGHGLEADLVQKKLSIYAGKKGQVVASPEVSVIDDGLIPGKYGSIAYDDEGTPAQKTVLIENGMLKGYMYDLQTAKKDNTVSTGNGRRESYKNRPIPRMRNTYIASGDADPESIISETAEGLLVTAMGGGQVNTITGDYVFEVSEGYLIKDGEITVPVRGATLTGNGPETLQLVEKVGSDLGFTIGVCGKEGQGVPVSDAQPTLAVKELIIGGTGNKSGSETKIRRL